MISLFAFIGGVIAFTLAYLYDKRISGIERRMLELEFRVNKLKDKL